MYISFTGETKNCIRIFYLYIGVAAAWLALQ